MPDQPGFHFIGDEVTRPDESGVAGRGGALGLLINGGGIPAVILVPPVMSPKGNLLPGRTGEARPEIRHLAHGRDLFQIILAAAHSVHEGAKLPDGLLLQPQLREERGEGNAGVMQAQILLNQRRVVIRVEGGGVREHERSREHQVKVAAAHPLLAGPLGLRSAGNRQPVERPQQPVQVRHMRLAFQRDLRRAILLGEECPHSIQAEGTVRVQLAVEITAGAEKPVRHLLFQTDGVGSLEIGSALPLVTGDGRAEVRKEG